METRYHQLDAKDVDDENASQLQFQEGNSCVDVNELDREPQSRDGDSFPEHDLPPITKKDSQPFPLKTSSAWKTTLNILNFLEGVGFLALPFAVRIGGVVAIALFFIIPFIFCYTGNILIDCLYDNDEKNERTRVRSSFRELGDALSPRFGGHLIHLFQQLDLFFTSVSYIVCCGSLLYNAFSFWSLSQTTWIAMVGAIVLVPTTFLQSLSEIAWLSFVSVAAVISVFMGIVLYGVIHTHEWSPGSLLFWSTEGAILSLTMIMAGYSTLSFLVSAEGEMTERAAFNKSLSLAFVISAIIKITFSSLGCLTFGVSTDQVVVNNFPSGPIRISFSVIFAVSCLLSYPLPFYPIFMDILQSSWAQRISAKVPEVVISIAVRVLVVFLTTLAAIGFPHFAFLMALLGSLITSVLDLLFPCIIHLKLKSSELRAYQITLDILVVGFGVMAMLFGVFYSVKSLVKDF